MPYTKDTLIEYSTFYIGNINGVEFGSQSVENQCHKQITIQCYAELNHSDWLKEVTLLATSNHNLSLP